VIDFLASFDLRKCFPHANFTEEFLLSRLGSCFHGLLEAISQKKPSIFSEFKAIFALAMRA